jgi:hypothetical protein
MVNLRDRLMKRQNCDLGLDGGAFPDLRLVVGRWHLVNLTLEAIQQVADHAQATGSTTWSPESSRDRTILTLLVYCYASGLFGSQDIEETNRQDQVVRYISAGEEITWNELRQYRRRKRGRLHQVLSRILELAKVQAESQSRSPTPTACVRAIMPRRPMGMKVINTRGNSLLEAEQRIQQAIQADSIAMDD